MWLNALFPLDQGFTFEFEFSFHQPGAWIGFSSGGDGMAFVLQATPDGPNYIGNDGKYMGYRASSITSANRDTFGIEFDSYKNDDQDDIDNNHVSLHSRGLLIKSGTMAGTSVNFKDAGKTWRAVISYNTDEGMLYVKVDGYLAVKAEVDWSTVFPSMLGPSTDSVYIGLTAGTAYAYQRMLVHQLKVYTGWDKVDSSDDPGLSRDDVTDLTSWMPSWMLNRLPLIGTVLGTLALIGCLYAVFRKKVVVVDTFGNPVREEKSNPYGTLTPKAPKAGALEGKAVQAKRLAELDRLARAHPDSGVPADQAADPKVMEAEYRATIGIDTDLPPVDSIQTASAGGIPSPSRPSGGSRRRGGGSSHRRAGSSGSKRRRGAAGGSRGSRRAPPP